MAQRIKREAPGADRRIVPQPMADKSMRRFMERDGDQYNKGAQKIYNNLVRRKQAVQEEHHPIKISSYYIVQNGAKQAPVCPPIDRFSFGFAQKNDFTKKVQLFCTKGLQFQKIFVIIVKLLKRRCKQYGQMFLLWQGCHVRYQGFSLSSSEQPYLEPQCQAREGDRGRFPEVYLRLHPLPALW